MRRVREYDSCLVICHGKCELMFVSSLKSNLRLKLKTYSNRNGKSSIQITGLRKLLSHENFNSLKKLRANYDLNIKNKKIENFKVFIVMDFDEPEYTKEMKENYLNKSMFKDLFLFEYIAPIFNDKNLDDVLIQAGYKIDIRKKLKSYTAIFPGESGDFDKFLEVKNKIAQVSKKSTNISVFLNYLSDQYKNSSKY